MAIESCYQYKFRLHVHTFTNVPNSQQHLIFLINLILKFYYIYVKRYLLINFITILSREFVCTARKRYLLKDVMYQVWDIYIRTQI